MSRVIEAKAIISAADKTGNVLDKIASKFKGLEKNAKAIGDIKTPKFFGNFTDELRRLGVAEKDMQKIRREMALFDQQLRGGTFGPMRASSYFRALDDWKSKTVAHWREVKAATEDAHKANKQYFAGGGIGAAARWGLGAFGAVGGAYAVGRMARAGIKASAESQRESARDYLAGLSDAESQRLKDEALRTSGRYQSVDANTMHERLRDTAMSTRSVDKALELSDVIAQGTTVLQSLKGKDKAIDEGRKFFSALDVLGKNIDPKEVKELFNGYIKALGVEGEDMDLGGVLSFARQSRAAGGALSNRFLMTTAPGLMRDLGDPQLGTALSSALSQNIGGRATKQSKAAQQEYGLRDASGQFLNADLAIRDPDKWAWQVLMPALQKKGVDVNDNIKVTEAVSKLFSNRVVGDVFSKLITQREQYQAKAGQYEKAPGLEAAGNLPGKDPFVAYEAVFAQLRNLATQAPVMDSAAKGLTQLSGAISSLNDAVSKGQFAKFFDAVGDFVDRGSKVIDSDVKDAKMIGGAIGSVLEFDKNVSDWAKGKLSWIENPGSSRLGTRKLESANDRWPSSSAAIPFVAGSEWSGNYVPAAGYRTPGAPRLGGGRMIEPPKFPAPEVSATTTYGTGVGGDKVIQAQLTGSAEVKGEAKLNVQVNAGSALLSVVERAEAAIRLAGQYTANGVGSTGKSSPDAAAPAVPHVGSPGNSPL